MSRRYDAVASMIKTASNEVDCRTDVMFKLGLTRTDKQRRWPEFRFFYPNVDDEGVEAMESLLTGTVDDLAEEGVRVSAAAGGNDAGIGFTMTSLDHDEVLVLQQLGAEMTEALTDLGIEVGDERGLGTAKAKEVREKRGRGHYKDKRQRRKKDKKNKEKG